MYSPMLAVQAAPTSASLVQGACCEHLPSSSGPNLNPLHMNWVLVDDTKGNPRVQMRWVANR